MTELVPQDGFSCSVDDQYTPIDPGKDFIQTWSGSPGAAILFVNCRGHMHPCGGKLRHAAELIGVITLVAPGEVPKAVIADYEDKTGELLLVARHLDAAAEAIVAREAAGLDEELTHGLLTGDQERLVTEFASWLAQMGTRGINRNLVVAAGPDWAPEQDPSWGVRRPRERLRAWIGRRLRRLLH